MPRFLKKRTKGVKPGSLILVGQQKQEKVRIRILRAYIEGRWDGKVPATAQRAA